jgi:hypothetical protein
MVEVMYGGLPGLAQLVVVFPIEVVRMFFYFKGFTNETRRVKGGRG